MSVLAERTQFTSLLRAEGQVWLRAAPEVGDRGWGKQVHPTYSQFVQNNGDWTLLPKFLLEFVRIKIQPDVAE
jgi:hypothetical protein